jgi:hypothetical protein
MRITPSTDIVKNYIQSNHLIGDPVVKVWDQEVCFPVVSGSSHMVANIMVTGGLHGH